MEYQAKELFAKHGVVTTLGTVVTVEPGLGHDDTKGALARALAHGAHTTDPGPSARGGRRSRVDG